jgi:hypothetical protein
MKFKQILENIFAKLLSPKAQKKSERIILTIAIASFFIHLLIIFLVDVDIIHLEDPSILLGNPIAAVYTPFSFILIYEVYLLIYYLPKSFSTYISKQYEIIALIIIRRLFKDLSGLKLSSDWFKINYDLQFTYDLIASVLLFFLIYLFVKQSKKRYGTVEHDEASDPGLSHFITIKKVIAITLVPFLFIVASYSLVTWLLGSLHVIAQSEMHFKDVNNVFFEQFFTILIIIDVILLLFSFYHTDEFHKVIRNSGFIISTILIRLSFSVSGLLNTALIISAIVFGLLILIIHNKFEKELFEQKKNINN